MNIPARQNTFLQDMKHKNNNVLFLFHVHDCDAIDVAFVNEHGDTHAHINTHRHTRAYGHK